MDVILRKRSVTFCKCSEVFAAAFDCSTSDLYIVSKQTFFNSGLSFKSGRQSYTHAINVVWLHSAERRESDDVVVVFYFSVTSICIGNIF